MCGLCHSCDMQNEHDCELPPITVSSWPRTEAVTRVVANSPQPSAIGPEKRTQVPEGTIWICRCRVVWKAERRGGVLGWHRANIWTTAHELRKAGYAVAANRLSGISQLKPRGR